jgi:CubicO group peptidase (beta-lactamase class C family)
MTADTAYFPVQGHCDPRFQGVRDAFEANFKRGAEAGASVAITLDGEMVVDLWGGASDGAGTKPWERDTITFTASTTKTATAISALLLADRGELDVDAPVARYWPKFAQNGKSGVLVRHCLGHTAGLAGFDEPLTLDDLYDWEKMTGVLERQALWWEPGTASGYHGMTQGFLVGEVIRRITGQSVGQFFAQEIARPLGADYHIGLAPQHDHRLADSIPPATPETAPGLAPDSISVRAYANPPIPRERWGEVAFRRAEIPAGNGVGNARAVARFNTLMSCGGEAFGLRLMSREGARRVLYQQSDGPDLVFIAPVKFGLGFALALMGMDFKGHEVCFWGGSGGSLIVNDLDARMTVAYVMNKLEGSPFGDARNASILKAAYQALEQRAPATA